MVVRPNTRMIIYGAAAIAILTAAFLFYSLRFEIAYRLHREMLRPAAARYGVSPKLVAAVIWQESRFRSDRVGQAGEVGLMQIMPATAQEWAKAEHITNYSAAALLDPGTNVLAGAWCLGRAIKRWSGKQDPLPYARTEYNAGRRNARRWDAQRLEQPNVPFVEQIGYSGTQRYVKEVLGNYRRYRDE
jgi:soluble lytic murein transglycosylase